MTVSTTNNVTVLQGNGVTTVFPFDFKVIDEDHLVVESREIATGDSTVVDVADYTVAGIGDSSGSITLDTALAATHELVIRRVVPVKQELDIVNQGGFYPDTAEAQLDLTVMGLQQVDEKVNRALVLPEGEDGVVLTPAANRLIGFDAFGNLGVIDPSGYAALRGPAGELTNNSGVVTTVLGGSAGHRVNMPAAGDGSAEGIRVEGGAGAGSGVMVRLRKNRAGGEPFMLFEEYSPTGFYYTSRLDNTPGLTAATHTWSTFIDSAGNICSRKAIIISGDAEIVGTSEDPDNPGFIVSLRPASAQPTMVTIKADVPVAVCTALADSTPDDSAQVHWSMIGLAGREVRAVEKEGDDCYMDGWVPPANGHGVMGATRLSHIEFRTGRIGQKGWGVKGGGNLLINFTTIEAIALGNPDAFDLYWDNEDGTGATGFFVVTNGANPGLFWSDGIQFTDGTNFEGPDPFGWTAVYAEDAGSPATVTETGAGRDAKTFTMTASNMSWDNAMQANATITGDQLIEYEVVSVDPTHELMVGIGTAVAASPIPDNAYGPTKTNITGLYQSGPTLFAMAAGTSTFVALDLPRALIAGDVLTMPKVNNDMILYMNKEPITTIAAGMAAVAYRATVLMRTVNSAAKSVRWRALS
jgi:hypothetical protein